MSKRRVLVGVGAVAVALGVVAGAVLVGREEAGRSELLVNGDFEGAARQDAAVWWDPNGGPYYTAFGNVFNPAGWRVWFLHGFPCEAGYITAQPEAKVIGAVPDPLRIYEGSHAVNLFTVWKCHDAGYLQRVAVEPGPYQAAVRVHSWYSQCSSKPHATIPLDYDCVTPFDAHDWVQIGIDPLGGVDPRAGSVMWSAPVEVYGGYGPRLTTPVVEVTGGWATVFLRSRTTLPLKHEDGYWDAARLWRVWRVWLPVVSRH